MVGDFIVLEVWEILKLLCGEKGFFLFLVWGLVRGWGESK